MEAIGCFVPADKTVITLQGVTTSEWNVNIVTPHGRQRLPETLAPGPVPVVRIVDGHQGPAAMATDGVKLCVYSERQRGRSESEMFYVVPSASHPEGCDVIFGRHSFIHKVLNPDANPVLPLIKTPELTEDEKKRQAEQQQRLAEQDEQRKREKKKEREDGRARLAALPPPAP